jgi:hypothetical protein
LRNLSIKKIAINEKKNILNPQAIRAVFNEILSVTTPSKGAIDE